jgi:hypothetical protein
MDICLFFGCAGFLLIKDRMSFTATFCKDSRGAWSGWLLEKMGHRCN